MAGRIMIVLDTSALLFWTLDRERLSYAATAAIADADRVVVSAISIWEIGIKVNKGNLDIPFAIRDFADWLEQVDRVEVVPVDLPTWLKNLELDWEHRDPADRTIVATAALFGCSLVTSDAAIRAFYSRAVW